MKILLIGSGGREHALAHKLVASATCSELFCIPGNPGIAEIAECRDISLSDRAALTSFCSEKGIGLVVVGPEQPLAEGMADFFASIHIPCFGPLQFAAQLESSKGFAKDFMARYGIPTALYRNFTSGQKEEAAAYIRTVPHRVVIKADGLAAGKGVLLPETEEEALSDLEEIFDGRFGDAGASVVIEEFMEGREASIFAICDGRDFVTLEPAQDHKRAYDNDEGPNTGGMGSYAPASLVTSSHLEKIREEIIRPVLDGMRAEGCPFIGCLFAGLMIKGDSVRVVEFNVRFGDPETQSVLSLFEGDLAALFYSAATGDIDKSRMAETAASHACTVVMASEGYPGKVSTGFEISGLERIKDENVTVFHAGTKMQDGKLLNSGGRVLAVTAKGSTLEAAREAAYEAIENIKFEGAFYRKDIAART